MVDFNPEINRNNIGKNCSENSKNNNPSYLAKSDNDGDSVVISKNTKSNHKRNWFRSILLALGISTALTGCAVQKAPAMMKYAPPPPNEVATYSTESQETLPEQIQMMKYAPPPVVEFDEVDKIQHEKENFEQAQMMKYAPPPVNELDEVDKIQDEKEPFEQTPMMKYAPPPINEREKFE